MILFGLSSHAQVTVGSSNHFRTETMTQVVLEGEAAEALYADLAKREFPEVSCAGGKAIIVSPFICIKSSQKTSCITKLFTHEDSFQVPSQICDGPNPSIIGVGNGKPNLPPSINNNLKLKSNEELILE